MQEKRRYKRLPIQLQLEVSEVFKQDNNVINNLNAEITVFDISKAGIGFTTSTLLPVGYYFNATILLKTSEQKILTVVKILHHEKLENNLYRYGCEFVGLAGIFDSVFEEYEQALNE
ncbi:MAG: PilZ domain-containing protein [Bacteroidales bacterium]|nr:PilZ domain-containing protein [Clostridium sp.]MCM1203253.1 PilZ domain-containing protein [Bacteroidales bacterium]